jgi:soluble lytic murein transglycosylase-like protein
MVRPRVPAVVLRAWAPASIRPGSSDEARRDVALQDLAAVRRLVSPVARLEADAPERVAAWTEVRQIGEAILGHPLDNEITFADLIEPHDAKSRTRVGRAAGVAARDAAAYALLGVGYSARETADIVSGRISLDALNTARRIRAAGLGRERAADYLDREYQRLAERRSSPPASEARTSTGSSAFDAFIEKYARRHGVDADLVRAIVDAESGYSPTAVSRAGAIGLMQLMPATARELGVDPHAAEQNLEGGIRYFAGLLKTFGDVELALVAYNGGPGYARRYARGDAVLYGETRAYVRRVLARLADSSR